MQVAPAADAAEGARFDIDDIFFFRPANPAVCAA
jgi:hypothetical protein